MGSAEILKKQYARMLVPDTDGTFFAEIAEFPGCFATGKTASEALQNLESVALDWIATAQAQGQDIPEPMENNDYSGKTVVRMSKGLHKRAAFWAQREGVSLNQFIITCIAEQVGERARPIATAASPPIMFSGMNCQVVGFGGTGAAMGFILNTGYAVTTPVLATFADALSRRIASSTAENKIFFTPFPALREVADA